MLSTATVTTTTTGEPMVLGVVPPAAHVAHASDGSHAPHVSPVSRATMQPGPSVPQQLRLRLRPRLLSRAAAGLLLPALLLALWQLATQHHWLPEQILPAPALVWQSLRELAQAGDLWTHLSVSLSRIGWSLLWGGTGGLLLGAAAGLSPAARAWLWPSFELVAQFPVLGWIPLLIIFVGIDEPLKVSAISLAVLVPVAVHTRRGIDQLPRPLLEVARVYGFTLPQVLHRVVLPAAAPSLLNGLRQGVMQAWLALVFVELLASSEGIGYLMVWGRQLLQMDLVVVGMLVIGAVGVALDAVLRLIESRLGAWRNDAF